MWGKVRLLQKNRVGHLDKIFAPGSQEFEQANLQKFMLIKCPDSCRGGGGGQSKLQMDRHISTNLKHVPATLWGFIWK